MQVENGDQLPVKELCTDIEEEGTRGGYKGRGHQPQWIVKKEDCWNVQEVRGKRSKLESNVGACRPAC